MELQQEETCRKNLDKMKSRMELQDEDYSPFFYTKKIGIVHTNWCDTELNAIATRKNMYHDHYAYDCVHRNDRLKYRK